MQLYSLKSPNLKLEQVINKATGDNLPEMVFHLESSANVAKVNCTTFINK